MDLSADCGRAPRLWVRLRVACTLLLLTVLSACGERLREIGTFEIEFDGTAGITAVIRDSSQTLVTFTSQSPYDPRGLRTVHPIEPTAVRTYYDLSYAGIPEKATCFVAIEVIDLSAPLQSHLPLSLPIRSTPNDETGPYAHISLWCFPVMDRLATRADQPLDIENLQFAMHEGRLEVRSLEGEALVGKLSGKLMMMSFLSF
jgi:hypothetical protein